MIRGCTRSVCVFLVALFLPALAFAQASITGVVKDTSAAVLPGVTVEVASPVLIEKVRSAVTDGSGQYRIVDLRPGAYSVTFTLPGFNTVKQDGVELSGSATVVVNADMRVGALEETITVTGEAATVDVQSTTKQQVINQETIAAVPTGRNYQNLGILIPGVISVNNSSTRQQDVGGSAGDNMAMLMAHGSKPQDMRVTQNGVSTATLQAGGGIGGSTPNVGAAAEVTIDTSAVSAELATGGPRINFIPRDGGNEVKGFTFLTFSNDSLQGSNLSQDIIDRGFVSASGMKTMFDLNPGVGGPIKRDKIWFFATGRYNVAQNYVGGMFENLNANNPNAWTYEADRSKPAFNDTNWKDAQIRLTTQATPKNKLAFTYDQQERCSCPWSISALRAPEAGVDYRFPQQRLVHAEWSSPITSKLLVEAVGLHRTERWGNMDLDSLDVLAALPSGRMISVTEQGGATPGLTYRGWTTYTNTWLENYTWRAAMSYVTGAHSFKAGVSDSAGLQKTRTYNFVPVAYRFNNGVPNQLTQYATPYDIHNKLDHDLGVYAQDKWTINRLTLTGGVRFDLFQTSFGEGHLYSGELVPGRSVTFPEADNLNWKDITPRMGAVYDLFGNGKTAVKASLNKYLGGIGINGIAQDPNPVNTHVNNVTRSWNDANGNRVADCDLTASTANGECGAMSNPNFGKAVATSTFDPELLAGWGNRSYNWEFAASVQQEIAPRVSVDIGYFRRWFGNFRVTDNLNVPANGYDQFTITVPTDSRLPNGGGYQVTGLDLNPAYFGIAPNNYNTLSDTYGKLTDHWNGMDFTLNARLSAVTVQGGYSFGRESINACDITSKVPELLNNTAGASPAPLAGPGFSGAGFNLQNVWLSPANCNNKEAWQHQLKLVGIYTIPVIDVMLSGTYQDTPGPVLAANYVVPNAVAAASLGRNLSGNAANTTLNMIEPGTFYGDRVHLVDLRFSKAIRAGRTRTAINVDVANLLNSNAVVRELYGYNPAAANASAWRRPDDILSARFVKFGVNFDF